MQATFYLFIAGLLTGVAVETLFLIGKLYKYRKNLILSKRQIERLEKHNSDLQLKLHEQARKLKMLQNAELKVAAGLSEVA